jgi:hypothetical protein
MTENNTDLMADAVIEDIQRQQCDALMIDFLACFKRVDVKEAMRIQSSARWFITGWGTAIDLGWQENDAMERRVAYAREKGAPDSVIYEALQRALTRRIASSESGCPVSVMSGVHSMTAQTETFKPSKRND